MDDGAARQPDLRMLVLHQNRCGLRKVYAPRQINLDYPDGERRAQNEQQVERKKIREFAVGDGAEIAVVLEMDHPVLLHRGADQPRDRKVADAVALVLVGCEIVVRAFMNEELQIGGPVADQAAADQSRYQLGNAPGRRDHGQRAGGNQRQIAEGDVAGDDAVVRRQAADKKHIAFAVAADQFGAQQRKCP